MKKNLIILTLSLFFIFPNQVQAADIDDLYGAAYFGMRVDNVRVLQLGGLIGYCPVDSVGVGLVIEQYTNLSSTSNSFEGISVSAEVRWFLEPFELAGSLGLLRDNSSTHPLFSGSGVYLIALTPSMAARFELKSEISFDGVTSFYGNLGARILF